MFFNLLLWNCFQKHNLYLSVADPDLQIRGGGGGGGGGSRGRGGGGGGGGTISKKIFPALLASVWSKNKGLGPSLPRFCHRLFTLLPIRRKCKVCLRL